MKKVELNNTLLSKDEKQMLFLCGLGFLIFGVYQLYQGQEHVHNIFFYTFWVITGLNYSAVGVGVDPGQYIGTRFFQFDDKILTHKPYLLLRPTKVSIDEIAKIEADNYDAVLYFKNGRKKKIKYSRYNRKTRTKIEHFFEEISQTRDLHLANQLQPA
ncbi:MAG: hypothetical protein ACK4ND_02585 [Cytophagaceae bacterium]